jgi:hypothetical protein
MQYDLNNSAYTFPGYSLKEGEHVRLRIVSLTFHATDIVRTFRVSATNSISLHWELLLMIILDLFNCKLKP